MEKLSVHEYSIIINKEVLQDTDFRLKSIKIWILSLYFSVQSQFFWKQDDTVYTDYPTQSPTSSDL